MRKIFLIAAATAMIASAPASAYSTWTSPTNGVTYCKSRQKHTGAFTKKFGGLLYWLWPADDGC